MPLSKKPNLISIRFTISETETGHKISSRLMKKRILYCDKLNVKTPDIFIVANCNERYFIALA
jgi:hypothetical protein